MEMQILESNSELIHAVRRHGIRDLKVLRAMNSIDRKIFVPEGFQNKSYLNQPLSIGSGQTISQPYIVALALENLHLQRSDKVLEIGTGSGYQTAILGLLSKKVYSIEIVESLGIKSRKIFDSLKYKNIFTRIGDGNLGWPEEAPFDKIIVSAAAAKIPPLLITQLKVGGTLVMPIGNHHQTLVRITKTTEAIEQTTILPVIFVPLIGTTEHVS